nr:glycosyltransferase [Brevibacterium yomogidense]
MAGSDATLNSHWDQEGFTMRTFEASGVGGVQLIDRSDVAEFYEPGSEVLVYDSEDHLIELCSRISRGALATSAIRDAAQKRTAAEHTFDHRVRILLEHL